MTIGISEAPKSNDIYSNWFQSKHKEFMFLQFFGRTVNIEKNSAFTLVYVEVRPLQAAVCQWGYNTEQLPVEAYYKS